MRLVKWTSRERVDLPDFMAVQGYAVGEFRRVMRFLTGLDTGGRIVRGFQVQPATTPNTTVIVKLDPGGGGPLGLFIGSELLTSSVNHGQLGGGSDINGAPEGNAQQILDFAALPAATYYVQLQFVYADGATDNRIFWNESTLSEFKQSGATRVVPGFDLQASLTPADPATSWQDIATVVWGGSTITAGNITDRRTFLFEGNPATGFQSTTWSDGTTGGMPDFNRNVARETWGDNSPAGFVRILARQIQDIKGFSSDGKLDVFSRVHQHPATATSTTLNTRAGVTLASLYEGATYTVGDGTTTFGDFNGATGLQDAITHVTQGSHPNHARILLKTYADHFAWTITSAVTLPSNLTLAIEGTAFGLTGGVQIKGTIAANIPMFTGGRKFVFKNLIFSNDTNGGPRIVDTTGYIEATDCGFYADNASAIEAVRCRSAGSWFTRCTFFCNVAMGYTNDTAQGSIFDACVFALVGGNQPGILRLYTGSTVGDPSTATEFGHRTSIRSCILQQVDTRGANDVSILSSRFDYTGGACLVGGGASASVGQSNLLAENCTFNSGSGVTDCNVYIMDSGKRTLGVTIRSCRLQNHGRKFFGMLLENATNVTVDSIEVYLGGSLTMTGQTSTVILLANVIGASIRNVVQDAACTWTGGTLTMIDVGGGLVGSPCSDVEISACTFWSNGVAATNTPYTQALFQPIKITANGSKRITIDKCRFVGVWDLPAVAINLTCNTVYGLRIANNFFIDTRGGFKAALDAIHTKIAANHFDCGDSWGLAIDMPNATTATNDLGIHDNVFLYSNAAAANLGNAGGVFMGNQGISPVGLLNVTKHSPGLTIFGWNNVPAQLNTGDFSYSIV